MFSIIIPVYNVAPYLRECLDSVLMQTFTDWEAICVDDGSTDESGAILDEYATRDARFRVIHQVNAGEGAARNTGISAAMSEWIVFVDGDDAVHKDLLENLTRAIVKYPGAKGLAHCEFVMAEKQDKSWATMSIESEFCYSDEYCRKTLNFTGAAWMSCFRRDLIDGSFGNWLMSADREFCLRYYLKNRGWVFLSGPLYFYRLRTGSIVSSYPSSKKVGDFIDVEKMFVKAITCSAGKFSETAVREILSSMRRNVLYTHNLMFFRMKLDDARKVFNSWLQLQKLYASVDRRWSWPWIVVKIAELTQNAMIVKFLVRGRLAFGKVFYGVLRGVKK